MSKTPESRGPATKNPASESSSGQNAPQEKYNVHLDASNLTITANHIRRNHGGGRLMESSKGKTGNTSGEVKLKISGEIHLEFE